MCRTDSAVQPSRFRLFSVNWTQLGALISIGIGSQMFNYPKYGNITIMYIWTGVWSTVFGIVTGAIGIKATSYPISQLKKIENLYRVFVPLVSNPKNFYGSYLKNVYSGYHYSDNFIHWFWTGSTLCYISNWFKHWSTIPRANRPSCCVWDFAKLF